MNFKNEKELQETILQEKVRGTPDLEIGQKYGVTFRYIERLITQSQGINISALKISKKIKTLYPKDFKEEQTTVWSFRQRGNWATHSGEYRGNWSPYIPRNVILKYSNPDELVLDYFCGAGTTAVESKLLGRRCIAFDINNKAIELAKKNVNFNLESQRPSINKEKNLKIYEPELFVNDARDLSFLKNNSIDLICAHPPYANIIHYTDSKKDDLSFFDIDEFLEEITKVAKESFRVLKPDRQCAILIGDMRRKKHIIPLGFKLIDIYLKAGFKLRELIIKRQHNCKTTGFWRTNSIKYNFLLLAHEYLPIFEKPKSSTFLSVKKGGGIYKSIIPSLDKLPIKKKLDKFETTTVWVLPEKDLEEQLNKNVINRYSKKNGLLFIKSPVLSNNPSYLNIDPYLQRIKEMINRKLPSITNGGFVAIQTQDVRIDGYIESLAKRIIDMLTFNNLWLKEIIMVTQEGENPKTKNSKNYLKTAHQYLLIYVVKK